MIKNFLPIVALTIVGTMIGCGGDSATTPTPTQPPTSSPPPAPPPAPTPADAEISLTGSFQCIDPFCDFADFELTITNTGGVGANLNFVRVENRNRQPILELGADHFTNAFGNNRLEAGETLDFFLRSQLGFVIIVGYRDDNGNKGQAEYFPDLPR